MVKNLLLCKGFFLNLGYFCFCPNRFFFIISFFFSFKNQKIRPLGLWKIHHGSTRRLSWVYEESIIALWAIGHGFWRKLSPLETGFDLYWPVSRGDVFLPEPWRIPPGDMTDCSQSHEGLLPEPWRTPGRAMTDRPKGLTFKILKTQKPA